jgi:hypothetical protein
MVMINILLNGKGGVGKSAIASYMTQYFKKNREVLCIDTDSNTPSYSLFKAFDVKKIFLTSGDEINPRAFDQMIEDIAASDAQEAVIDVGSSSFAPLLGYILTNDVLSMLESMGHEVRFHVVIAGGVSLDDSVSSFAKLCKSFPDVEMVLWLNGYPGPLIKDGKPFDETALFKENVYRIFGTIEIPALKKETFGYDLENMMAARKTFAEQIDNPGISIMSKQRLKMVWADLQAQMTEARL